MAIRRMIHIADMHFSDKENKSLLQKEKYVEDWIDSLKDIEALDTLVISGDIVDRGGSEETYELVDNIIKRLKEEVGIKNILCVPGNHDVSRNLLMGISGDAGVNQQKLWEYYEVKLKYYWNFIKRNKLNNYQNSGLVSYEILYDPNMILLGLDSTDRIGLEDEYGFINLNKLKEALKNLLGESGQKYRNYIKIAILHHRPVTYESDSQTFADNNSSGIGQYGTCERDNWQKVKKILLSFGVHYVLTGHVHGSQSGQVRPFELDHDEMNYSTVGSIGVDFSKEIAGLINFEQNQELRDNLDELRCHLSLNGNHNAYNIWTFSDNGLVREEQYKYIIDEGKRCWCLWGKKDFEEEEELNIESNIFDEEVVTSIDNNKEEEDYEEKILEIVRENELYKTGHYHWKNSARLNWIDTSFFFQHREKMFYIARGINELFEKNESLRKADCIIGLGIKGSILLSYVRFLFPEKRCSYLPENKNEYNDYEMALFEKDEKISSIVVLTDVVHSGNTIKEFAKGIYEKNKKFLNVNVVTIFDATPNGRIAPLSGEAKFLLFSLAKLKVIDCPGGGDNCNIYMKKLANVIEYRED